MVYAPSGRQLLGLRNQAWGMMVPLQAGNSGAVIDGVVVVGGAGYGGPRVLSVLEVASRPGQCGGTWPWQGPDSILSTCAIGGVHRLVGTPPPGDDPGVDMVIKVAPPASRSGCWTATAIVIHYHVGIRHYTVTSTGVFAACQTTTQEHDAADLALGQPD
jgi:hypothetical protein